MRKGEKRPETLTAERLAALIEAPETPPAVRDLLRVACESVDIAAAVTPEGHTDPLFKFPHPKEITPALVRRRLPAMLRRVGGWRLVDWMGKDLEAVE